MSPSRHSSPSAAAGTMADDAAEVPVHEEEGSHRTGKQGKRRSDGSVVPQDSATAEKKSDVVPAVIEEDMNPRIKLFREQLLGLHQDLSRNEHYQWFAEPVDPEKYGLPDYFDIIKRPIDLRTMREKVLKGDYDSDPHLFVQDFDLMINNAVTYNPPKSAVANSALELQKLAQKYISQRFKNMLFCCGKKRVCRIHSFACYAKPANECTVEPHKKYAILNDTYSVCMDCYDKEGDEILIYKNAIDPNDRSKFCAQKEHFEAGVNDKNPEEPFVQCESCGRRMHRVCVRHVPDDSYDPVTRSHVPAVETRPYTCFNCTKDPVPTFHSSQLMPTLLSSYIQNKVNMLHERLKVTSGLQEDEKQLLTKVRIRVLSTGHKVCDVKKNMRGVYSVSEFRFPTSFPYTSRAIFAFQDKSDGTEVAIFGFHVNEYGDDAPAPNSRRVYLSYLDSVNFFQPKVVRTLTFQEILLSYFSYVRGQGFRYISIWSCPPRKMDDYVFYAHPLQQKFPTGKRLEEWYKRLLDKGLAAGCLTYYTDVSRRANLDQMKVITKLPYMDGDLWPQKIEDAIEVAIKEMEEYQNEHSINPLVGDENNPNTQVSQQSDSSQRKRHVSKTAPPEFDIHKVINDNILLQMKGKLDVFFDISLCDEDEPVRDIVDVDIDMNCPLMDGREAYLHFCRTEYCEFSDLRMATYSTIRMVQLVLQTQVTESLRYAAEIMHVDGCKSSDCQQNNCSKWKTLIQRFGDQELITGSKRTGHKVGKVLLNNMWQMFNFHAQRCDGSCGNGVCRIYPRA